MATLSQALSAQDSTVVERWGVTDDKVYELVRRLVAAYDRVRVVASGSWARGEAGPFSDFDVAVLIDHEVADAKVACKSRIEMEMDILVRPVTKYKEFAFVRMKSKCGAMSGVSYPD